MSLPFQIKGYKGIWVSKTKGIFMCRLKEIMKMEATNLL